MFAVKITECVFSLKSLGLLTRGLKTPVAGWHCHPEDLGPSGRFWVMIFWKPARKIRLNSQNYVRTVQNMSGQFKMCPYSSKFIHTAQNMSGEHMFFVDGERLLCIFLVRCERYLCVFHPEDFLVPPGRFWVFRPLMNAWLGLWSLYWRRKIS